MERRKVLVEVDCMRAEHAQRSVRPVDTVEKETLTCEDIERTNIAFVHGLVPHERSLPVLPRSRTRDRSRLHHRPSIPRYIQHRHPIRLEMSRPVTRAGQLNRTSL